MATNPKMSHEADVQRQHIRLQVPVKVTLEKVTLDAYDWSNGGVALQVPEDKTLPKSLKEGKTVHAIFHFDFNGFALTAPMELEVIYIKEKAHRIGCRFVNITKQQLAILQYMVSSTIAGEVVGVGDILDVAGRNNLTRTRSIPSRDAQMTAGQKFMFKLRHSMRFAIITAIFIGMLGFVGISIYQRLFIITAISGEVTADLISVDAPAGGKVYFKPLRPGTKVNKGDVLLTVASNTGSTALNAESPCDCIVKRRLQGNNNITKRGDPVLELVAPDAVPYVEVFLPSHEAVRLAEGQKALLDVPGRRGYLRGKIVTIESGRNSGSSRITIIPEDPIPVAMVDDPVKARFDVLNLF